MLKKAFYLTAVLNVVAAIHAVTMPDQSRMLLFGQALPFDEAARTTHQLMWLFVGLFGVGYFKAARDERYVEPLLLLGGCGKLLAALVWLTAVIGGVHSLFLIQGILFDGLLGLYFVVTLWRRTQAR